MQMDKKTLVSIAMPNEKDLEVMEEIKNIKHEMKKLKTTLIREVEEQSKRVRSTFTIE